MKTVVVIGASAGGVSGLLEIARGLPSSLPAAVMVVLHVGQNPSVLPTLMTRAGALPATHAVDGEPIVPGRIYVAPPDYHLLVDKDRVRLSHGPRENHTRPAIDPLFRSAARAYGDGVIGVVLSGALSDGAAGLMAVVDRGGRAIVQDPSEALMSGMPASAVQLAQIDTILPVAEIANAITDLVLRHEQDVQQGLPDMADDFQETKAVIEEDLAEQARDTRQGQLTLFTCPDCGGSLWQSTSDDLLAFECHVGHTWSWEALAGQKSEQLETALWASVRLLVERATLNRQLAARSRNSHGESMAQRFQEQALRDEDHADTLRSLLEALPVEQGSPTPVGE